MNRTLIPRLGQLRKPVEEEKLERYMPLAMACAWRFNRYHYGKCFVSYDEIKQHARIGLWLALSAYEDRGGDFLLWATYQISFHLRDCMRMEGRQSRVIIPPTGHAKQESQQPSHMHQCDFRDEFSLVYQSLLSWVDRLILRLYFFEHYSHREIGRILDISYTNVRSIYYTVLERMRVRACGDMA